MNPQDIRDLAFKDENDYSAFAQQTHFWIQEKWLSSFEPPLEVNATNPLPDLLEFGENYEGSSMPVIMEAFVQADMVLKARGEACRQQSVQPIVEELARLETTKQAFKHWLRRQVKHPEMQSAFDEMERSFDAVVCIATTPALLSYDQALAKIDEDRKKSRRTY